MGIRCTECGKKGYVELLIDEDYVQVTCGTCNGTGVMHDVTFSELRAEDKKKVSGGFCGLILLAMPTGLFSMAWGLWELVTVILHS